MILSGCMLQTVCKYGGLLVGWWREIELRDYTHNCGRQLKPSGSVVGKKERTSDKKKKSEVGQE